MFYVCVWFAFLVGFAALPEGSVSKDESSWAQRGLVCVRCNRKGCVVDFLSDRLHCSERCQQQTQQEWVLNHTVRYRIVIHNTTWYCKIQYYTTQRCTILHNTISDNAVHCYSILCHTSQYCSELPNTAWYYTQNCTNVCNTVECSSYCTFLSVRGSEHSSNFKGVVWHG